ncbi:MAG: T9SS type A sorting domain-containing protein, partial [Candidatus Zixiibacteriota bacterium]
NNSGVLSDYRGVKIVKDTTMTALTARAADLVYFPTAGDGFTENEKYASLTDGFGSASTYADSSCDLVQVVATGPLSLAADEEDTVAFALLAGDSLADIIEAAKSAQFLMDSITTDVSEEPGELLPDEFALLQNYPNPFNPRTTIRFYLPRAARAKLTVYNILGRQVAVLLDRRVPQGFSEVVWDGTDYSGSEVASGVYFYCLKSDGATLTRRMVLLK